MSICSARFSGSWYPADQSALQQLLETASLSAKTRPNRSEPDHQVSARAALLPHAGLHYSAAMIMAGLECINPTPQQHDLRIIILAPSHYLPLEPDHLYTAQFSAWATPLGRLGGWSLPVATGPWQFHPQAIAAEHAVEMFLPCLKYRFPECQVLAIIVPEIRTTASLQKLTEVLETLMDSGTAEPVVIASSDMTHYGARFGNEIFGREYRISRPQVDIRDLAALELLAAPDPQEFFSTMRRCAPTMCGRFPALLLSGLAQHRKWRGELLGRYNSVEVQATETTVWPPQVFDSPESEFVSYAGLNYFGHGV